MKLYKAPKNAVKQYEKETSLGGDEMYRTERYLLPATEAAKRLGWNARQVLVETTYIKGMLAFQKVAYKYATIHPALGTTATFTYRSTFERSGRYRRYGMAMGPAV